jgi:hypothetical protein
MAPAAKTIRARVAVLAQGRSLRAPAERIEGEDAPASYPPASIRTRPMLDFYHDSFGAQGAPRAAAHGRSQQRSARIVDKAQGG